MATTYDNQFYRDNVYGHALALLETVCVPDNSVHLDLGCGFGRIAEPLVASLGRVYVGIDADPDGLASLSARGFEAHRFCLTDFDTIVGFCRDVLDGRRLGSLTIIDTLEHLYDPKTIMSALHAAAGEFLAPVVVSVPNIAHTDIAIKLLMGRFDYTEEGLLDRTHVNLFTEERLLTMMASAGWHPVGKNDVLRRKSDQHFPANHVALADGSALNRFLARLRDQADSLGYVNQLVRLFMAGPQKIAEDFVDRDVPPITPFLTVLIRTEGKHPRRLRDIILTLSGQTLCDFEVLVIGDRLDADRQLVVERILEDSATWLREKTVLVKFDNENYAGQLNGALKEARGTYFAILDEGDLVFANWTATFGKLAADNPGAIQRGSCVSQLHNDIELFGQLKCSSAVSGFEQACPSSFELLEHLDDNRSPTAVLAFPMSIFRELNHRFDESLNGEEVWDFLLGAISLCGVASAPEIIAICRRWGEPGLSEAPATSEDWDANRQKILMKWDTNPVLLPPSSARKLRQFMLEESTRRDWEKEAQRLRETNSRLAATISDLRRDEELQKAEIAALADYARSREIALAEIETYTHARAAELDTLRSYVETVERNLAEARAWATSREAALAEIETYGQARDAELDTLRSYVDTLERNLAEARAWATSREAALAEIETYAQARDAELDTLRSYVDTLERNLAEARAWATSREAALAEIETYARARDAELDAIRNYVDTLEGNLTEAQGWARSREAAFGEIQTHAHARESESDLLRNYIQKLECEVAELQSYGKSRDSALHDIEIRVMDQDREIHDLRLDKRLKDEKLAAVYQSVSWRLTAPIRAARKFVRRPPRGDISFNPNVEDQVGEDSKDKEAEPQ